MQNLTKVIFIVIFGGILLLYYDKFGMPFVGATDLVKKEHQPFLNPESYSKRYIENDTGQTFEQFESIHETRSYNVYVPDNLGEGKHPAIFVFHGAMRTGASVVERWKSNADKHGLIIVGAHGHNKNWGKGTDIYGLIPALVKDAKSKYPIDKDRMFMFGHSAGALYANWATMRYPDLFVASAIHGGALKANKIPLKSIHDKQMPIIYILGNKDTVFSKWPIEKSARKMSKRGHDTEFVLLIEHTHWYYDLAPQINNIAWDFFERHID